MKRSEFIKSHWTETTFVDTLLNTKDSLIIHSKNAMGFTRQKIDIKNVTGRVQHSYTNYIDTNGLIAYREHWSFTCQNTDPNDYDGILDNYRRYVYDSKGTLISEYVHDLSTGTWRYNYLYTDNGDRYSKSLRIKRNEFWAD
ncbi:hypothetical protein FPE01S_02_04420 [Flavihumibacter petaseus NBRC 106054]|uniref:Uncharacterized protein n=1 Tax=Flavihumibacter petaseus NBRC 106054 TaxID=1220578 RepID=A0A0E9N006_9BACT|nr:hypothetical protein FPE01S_02_04420 [Flavihumibacter petaseus NBRC 106054]